MNSPTLNQFTAYQGAFDYFNRALFAGTLPPCMLNFSRKNKCMGFYAPGAWINGEKKLPEISINPEQLYHPPQETMQTLVHEMCHHWQFCFGKPSRTGYHNHEWAAKMESIGLMPSSTGAPGGKKVGQKIADYAIEGGRFLLAFGTMPKDVLIPWTMERREKKQGVGNRSKVKYTCPCCGLNAWGKPDIVLMCGECTEELIGG